MLEFEKKFMLSKKEYEQLCHIYATYPVHIQVNFYYDTEDFSYNSKGITCRIRKKGDTYKATIKTHHANVADCSIEKCVDAKSECDVSLFEGMEVIGHGQLLTERKEIMMLNGITLVLDKNTYLGTEDYELEIEYEPHMEQYCEDVLQTIVKQLAKNHFDSLLCDFHKRMNVGLTKSERFFARKKK